MQPRPSFDRALLIPIAISIVSILGIAWILSTSNLGKSFTLPTAIPSSTSSPRPRTPTPSPPAPPTRQQSPPSATEMGPESYPGPLAENPASTTTTNTETLPTPSATYTPGRFQLLSAGKYDDTNPNIAYDKNWTALKNPGTENAYKGTLHGSAAVGNEASFRFTGRRVRLGYQRGKYFGTVTVLIDGQSYSFHEQAFDLVWRSPELAPGDHFVRILHQSGEFINLDYIEVLE